VRQLFVIRHAIAHPRNESSWPNDDERPLTVLGARKFALAARGFAWLHDPPEELLSSSLVRARQTAEILERRASFPGLIEVAELSPDAEIPALIAALKRRSAMRLAIVGHEPNLSLLVGALLRGFDSRAMVQMKKGAVAHLEFVRRIEPGKGQLIAVLPPRVLRALAYANKKKNSEKRSGD
jgi:phosphohistidine phosphatase